MHGPYRWAPNLGAKCLAVRLSVGERCVTGVGVVLHTFFIHEDDMKLYPNVEPTEATRKWTRKINEHSFHNKLSKKVRESLVRLHDEGIIDSCVDCALMKPPSSFVVSYMRLLSELDIGAHDLDNGNHILTNVNAEKLSLVMEERAAREKNYLFGWSGGEELSKLGYLSYLSLPLDELIEFTVRMTEHRSKMKYSSSKAFSNTGKRYKISIKASDNFRDPETRVEEIQAIKAIFEKALTRVRKEAPAVTVGNSWGIKNSKFDMYVDVIPAGLLNYFKLIGLPHYTIYLDKSRYDTSTTEGNRQLMVDSEALIKYNP